MKNPQGKNPATQDNKKLDFSEESFHHLFDNMMHGFIYCKALYDEQGQVNDYIYITVNAAYEALTGLQKVSGKKVSEVLPELLLSNSSYFETIGRVLSSGKPEKFEIYIPGFNKWFSVSLYSPEKSHFACFIDNITERKESEAKIIKLNRLYSFISQINQTIVYVKDEQTLFRRACKIALEFGKFKMAWIGKVDPIHKKTTMLEECGTDPEDLHLYANVPYQAGGPQDHAISTGTSFICNDIENELLLTGWKPYALKRSIRSCMVLPLKKSGKVIGTFNLYSSSLHFFDKEEIALLEEAVGDISFAMDIFEKEKVRLETEKKIEQSETNLKAIFENTSEGFVLLDQDYIVKAFNSNAKKISLLNSYREIEAGKSIFINFDASRIDYVKSVFDRVLAGESIQYERSYVKDGASTWLTFSLAPVKENGLITGLCVTGQDITDKKIIEQQKEFDDNNLKSLIDNTNDLMWSVDTDFKLITSNSAFNRTIKQLSGFALEKGTNVLTEIFDDEKLKHFKKYYERAFAGETFTEIEHSPDSVAEISFHPILNVNSIIGTACYARNITEQKQSEENLKRSEAHLKSANKDLETFIYRASHDLRGPLSSIIGLTNVSRLDITDEKALEYITMIQQSTKKLDDTLIGLVQSMAIKDITKFEDEINFESMINDVLDRFRYYQGFKRMNFETSVELQEPFISSKLILQPVLQNLIENAIKYQDMSAAASYASIRISDTATEIMLLFEDNGMGMESSIQDKVFDVYYKGTQKSEGSGLGLYIVKTAVERLNGAIKLQSTPGKGSTFTVVLPKKQGGYNYNRIAKTV